MFERDYIMRMLQTFFNDLDAWIRKRRKLDLEKEEEEGLEELYQQYLKNNRSYFHKSTKADLIAVCKDDPDGIYKAEMLAALLYQDALLYDDGSLIQKELLEKSLMLYQYINDTSHTFSIERLQIIKEIKDRID